MTITLEAPAKLRASAAVPHVVDAGDYDTRSSAGLVSLRVGVQLPAHYLAALLYREVNYVEDIATVGETREMVAILLISCTFREMEDAANALATVDLSDDDLRWLETCRIKVAEAFPGCDPWASR